jgi:NDP-sugar pyrophosphorylase family protein
MPRPIIHALADVQSTVIGGGTRIWQFVIVLASAKIGDDCKICSHRLIENDVMIEYRVTVKSGLQLWDVFRLRDSASDLWGGNGLAVAAPSVGDYSQIKASDQRNHEPLSR